MNLINFGRDICGNYKSAKQKEWLVTNGIGGFASGTISGSLTRRYHGLLIAALKPPLGRTLLVAKFDETVEIRKHLFELNTNNWASGTISPHGYHYIESFYLDGSIPTWIFSLDDVLFKKQIWMRKGENTTFVRYSYLRAGPESIDISIIARTNAKDYHGLTHKNVAPQIEIESGPYGMSFSVPHIPVRYYLLSTNARSQIINSWEQNFYLAAEAERGESSIEDHLTAGVFTASLLEGQSVTIVASTNSQTELDSNKSLEERKDYEEELISRSNLFQDPVVGQLILAADQFIADRPTNENPEGKTILAGYPWFSDWGRDTMISLPGLTLATGRPEIARDILKTYAVFIDQGMLPNRFPDHGEMPEYNTADATLWFFEAVRAYVAETGDLTTLGELFPALEDIINWHLHGTRFQIHCDEKDGLLYAGSGNSQLTWMDVRIDNWPITPRIGKPVEINALWFNALCSMIEFTNHLGKTTSIYEDASKKTKLGFKRFWNPQKNCLYDVIDGPTGDDPTIRPNQILAVSLFNSPIEPQLQKAVVDLCGQHLLTSFGLHSLAQTEPGYIGWYQGDRWQRDNAYHQGTVWGWLIGPFVSAYLKVYHNYKIAWSFLEPIFQNLSDHGLGSISEIFDGNPPHKPNGCIAQAWSVAEVLRVIQQLERENND